MRFDPADLYAATHPLSAPSDAAADRRLNDTLFDAAADRLRRLPPERFESLEELRATAQAIADEAQAHGLKGIDHLLGNDDLSAFHAVQGSLDDPAALRAYIGRAQFLAHAARARSLDAVGDRLRDTRNGVVASADGLWNGLVRGLDQNGDGKLGFDDVGAFFTRTLDQNGDGKLNLADVGALFDQTGDGKFGLDDAAVLVGGLLAGRRR